MKGVYYHKDLEVYLITSYSRLINLFQNGNYWGCWWEVVCDFKHKVSVAKTCQQVFRTAGCRPIALWWRCATRRDLMQKDIPSEYVNFHWRPDYEVNPGEGAWSKNQPGYLPQEPEDRRYNRLGQPVSDKVAKRREAEGRSFWELGTKIFQDSSGQILLRRLLWTAAPLGVATTSFRSATRAPRPSLRPRPLRRL